MIKKEIKIAFENYQGIEELDLEDQQLCREAEKALENSHSPYSRFKVGAAVRLKSGKVIYGNNQENVAYPSGLCAERVAFFTIGANYPDDEIMAIAVTAHTHEFALTQPTAPCGSCLQVMAEYEKKQEHEFNILLYCLEGPVWKARGVGSFLPFLFFEDRLGK